MTISSQFRQAVFAQETSDGDLILLTITHPDMADTIRVVLNTEDITSRGNLFKAYPFQLTKPERSGDRPPKARLAIDNVDQQIAIGVRSIRTPLSLLIETVRIGDFDSVEESMDGFQLTNVQINAQTVSGDLGLEDLLSEPYPKDTFTPGKFRGGF